MAVLFSVKESASAPEPSSVRYSFVPLTVEELDFEVEASHHEVAPGQNEIAFKFKDALKTADAVITFKQAIKAIVDNMATFENYFVADKATHKENMNPYYKLMQKEEICDKILKEFGLPIEGSHIINGHVPVKLKDGESPIKGNGKLFVIDGGLSSRL